MLIRPASAGDVSSVLPMLEQMHALNQQWDAARFGLDSASPNQHHRWLMDRRDAQRGVFLVAEAGTGLVAFLIGSVEHQTPADPQAEHGVIHHLWVEPDYRHEGLGRQLTMLALEMFANLGVSQVRLSTATANESAREMFASCGFRPSAVEMSIEITPTKGQRPSDEIITLGDPTWPTIS
jgi:ribosomal protein S18 acetylase RimI-like enzyme